MAGGERQLSAFSACALSDQGSAKGVHADSDCELARAKVIAWGDSAYPNECYRLHADPLRPAPPSLS